MQRVKKYLDFVCFGFFVFILETILRINVCLPIFQKKALFIDFIIIVFLDFVFSLVVAKYRRIVQSVVVIFLSLYAFAQNYHYVFFNTFFSFSKLSVVSELKNVIKEIIAKFDFRLILIFVPLVLWFVYLKINKSNLPDNKKASILGIILSLLVNVFAMQVIFNDDGKSIDEIDPQTDLFLYKTMCSKDGFYTRFGLLFYLYSDIKDVLKIKRTKLSEEEKQGILQHIESSSREKNGYSGIFENKNLIVVLAESFCPQAIDKKLTPTLYSLVENGYYFDNFYAPLYPANTNDCEFISQTSLMPSINAGTTSYEYSNNYFPYSLASMLKNNNYDCNSYHSFNKSFYNREPFHEALGFSFYYAKDDLGIYTDDNFVEYYNWVDDKILFEKVINNTNLDHCFYDFVITASGHLPYMDLRPELYEFQSQAQEYYDCDPETAYYFASQMKLDEGIATLMSLLEEKKKLDDTVIVIFGDHYPYGANDTTQEYLFDKLNYDYEKNKVPMIIYNTQVKGEKISKLSSTFDILPTLANLYSLDISNSYIIGKDIFSDEKSYVLFQNHSVLTEDFYYNGSNQTISTFGNENNYNLQEIMRIYNDSQLVLSSDYYRN